MLHMLVGVVTPPIGLTLWADVSEEDNVSDTNPKYIAAQLREFKRIRSEKHIGLSTPNVRMSCIFPPIVRPRNV